MESDTDPGTALRELDLSFYGHGNASDWARFATEANFETDPEHPKDGISGARFVGLPDPVTEDAEYLTGAFHQSGPVGKKHGDVHWHLGVRRCLGSTPPPRLKSVSEKIGGIARIFPSIIQLWPGSKTVEIEASATFEISGLPLSLPKFTNDPSKISVSGADYEVTPHVVACQLDIKPSFGIANSILLMMADGKPRTAIISGVITVELSESVLDLTRKDLWRTLQLFRPT